MVNKIITFRDDDINRFTDIATFQKIHDLFLKYNKVHTCVVEMKDLWESRGLWHLLMTLPNIEIALHCWEHMDYSIMTCEQARVEIKKALDYYNMKCNGGYGRIRPIKVMYPPWNRISSDLARACIMNGIMLDNRHDGEILNFHWWSMLDNSSLIELENKLNGKTFM